jgi:hypothetical protein
MKKLVWLGLLLSSSAFGLINLPEFQGGIQPNAVWQIPDKLHEQCNQTNSPDDYLDCMITGMQKAKASAQAIAMMKFSRGTVIDNKKMGNVTVLRVAVPAADHSEEFYVINNNGDLIDVDDQAILSGIEISKASNYQSILQKYPSVSLWPGNHQYPVENDLPSGITQLVFTYSLLNGCMACELAGIAKVALNFDSVGNFQGAQLLSLDPPPIAASDLTQ